ncbi:hypothetical protein [Isosphaera pallida]|nr:hypothetical protein [Isosphaera pallida]
MVPRPSGDPDLLPGPIDRQWCEATLANPPPASSDTTAGGTP